MSRAVAIPSRDDPVVSAASEWIGGPLGRRAACTRTRWTPVGVALVTAGVVMLIGFLLDQPCRSDGWFDRSQRSLWTSLCYSDVPFLYSERGLFDGQVVYLDTWLEYPVLTGLVMQLTAVAVTALGGGPGYLPAELAERVLFYDVTTIVLTIAALVTVAATAVAVYRRPWDAMLVAASPVLLLSGTINWDLLAVAFTALAVLAWSHSRPGVAGALIGLGTAAKLYPVLLLGPVLLVALRSADRRAGLRQFGMTLAAAGAAWAVVNVPVMVLAPRGWAAFFEFNADREVGFGSTWQAWGALAPGLVPHDVDLAALVAGAVALALIVVVAWTAPEQPRLAQLAFLAVASFLLVNKVWSPQYALWLLPLAVLARPRVRDLALWQATEVLYFVAVWRYLATLYDPDAPLLGETGHAVAIVIRVIGVLWLVGVVIRDLYRPEYDPVRPYLDRDQGVRER